MNPAKFDEPHFRALNWTTSLGINTFGSTQALAKASSAQLESLASSVRAGLALHRSILIGQAMNLSGATPTAR